MQWQQSWKNLPVCDPVPEKNEDLSSCMPLEVEKEIECRLGDTGLDVLVGDTDADRLGGEPGGVIQGVELWDATRRLYGTLGLMTAMLE